MGELVADIGAGGSRGGQVPRGGQVVCCFYGGKVDASDTMVSGVQSSATFGTTVIRLCNRQIKVVQADARTGQIKSGTDDKRGMSDAIPVTRLWRQLIGRP